MNTLNDLEQMKTINIFFYEDKNQTNECKRLESFKKFLLSAEPCSGSEWERQAVELLMWINEWTYRSEMHFVYGGDYSYIKVLERIKYFIYSESFDLFEKIKTVEHIASCEKYSGLNTTVFNMGNPGAKIREIREAIASYMADQYIEAHSFIDEYTEEYTPKSFIEEVKKRLNAFLCADPFGYKKDENKYADATSVAKRFLKIYDINDIYDVLDSRVYKQKKAKKAVSVMLYNHMKRVAFPEVEQEKRNYLMVGPTGCGKTEIARALKEISPLPIVVVDGRNITGAGWRGQTIGEAINDEFNKLPLALKERKDASIIIIDEADKLVKKAEYDSDNFTFSKQTSLLKAIEDGCLSLDCKDNIQIKNATFVLAGAFEGLKKEKAEEDKYTLGFSKTKIKAKTRDQLLSEVLIKYGMKCELAGRVSNLIELNELSKKDYVYIQKNYKTSALNHAKNLFDLSGIKLEVSDEALEEAAEQAIERGLGVRGNNAIINKAVDEVEFDALKNKEKVVHIKKMPKNL